MQGAETPEAPKRCKELWFEDGNIVLQAERTVFQLYNGVLRRESPVFADMLSLSGKQAEYCGQVPLVRMPDTAEEMTLFLSVIFIHQFMDDLCATPNLPSILSMAMKYQAIHVYRRAVTMLSLEFPSTLKDYDALRTNSGRASGRQSGSEFWALATAVINVALRHGSNVLLPAAFLRAASYETSDILAQDALDLSTRTTILVGRDRLSQMARKESFAIAFSHGMGCIEWSCRTEWARVRAAVEVSTNFIDPFFIASPPVNREKICGPTRSSYAADQKGREGLWAKLPIVFGLPPWEALTNEENLWKSV